MAWLEVGVFSIAVYLLVRKQERNRLHRWQRAAVKLGLSFSHSEVFGSLHLRGTIEDVDVEIDILAQGARLNVRTSGIPESLVIEAPTLFHEEPKILSDEPVYNLVVSTPGVLQKLRIFLSEGLGYAHSGWLKRTLTDASVDDIVTQVRSTVVVAKGLAAPSHTWPHRLRERLAQELSGETRRKYQTALIKCSSLYIPSQLPDFSLKARLKAANKEGEDLTEVLAEIVHHPEAPLLIRGAALRQWAVIALPGWGDLQDSLAALLMVEPDRTPDIWAAIVGDRKNSALREHLLTACRGGPPHVQLAILKAIFVTGDQRDFPLLFAAFDAFDSDVRTAAIEALGRWGSLDEIVYLAPLCRGLGSPARVKIAAREAIASIQERYGGEEGLLSIAEGLDHGKLSPSTSD